MTWNVLFVTLASNQQATNFMKKQAGITQVPVITGLSQYILWYGLGIADAEVGAIQNSGNIWASLILA